MKCSPKLTAEITINTVQISKIVLLSKYPMLASWVENPPIATVENAWQIASKTVMPAAQYASAQAVVRPK